MYWQQFDTRYTRLSVIEFVKNEFIVPLPLDFSRKNHILETPGDIKSKPMVILCLLGGFYPYSIISVNLQSLHQYL